VSTHEELMQLRNLRMRKLGERPMKDKEDSTTIDWHDLTPKQQSEIELALEEWLDREEQEQDQEEQDNGNSN
jgi:hypothetical protein